MYKPNPVNTNAVEIPEELLELTEQIAENVHENWALGRIKDGWTYGEVRDDASKMTPCLVPYDELPEIEKEFDRRTAMETLKLIMTLGYRIEKQEKEDTEEYMNINVEFLGPEQIENVITAMHYPMDKTIFFGYADTIKECEKEVSKFLKNRCAVKDVVFQTVEQENLDKVYQVMKDVLDQEYAKGHRLFFDVTGGESLVLVAFGMLVNEYKAPMHQYDVKEDRLIELNPEHPQSIGKVLEQKKVLLDLGQYIELYGGKINYDLDKDNVTPENQELMEFVKKLWPVMLKYKDNWNYYASILQQDFKDKEKNRPLYTSTTLVESRVSDWGEFCQYMAALAEAGAIVDYKKDNLSDVIKLEKGGIQKKQKRAKFSFRYRNAALKECLWKSGTTLELHVYDEIRKSTYDCEESVFIDWDGDIRGGAGKDVYNEIDVIGISNNLPIFISCKCGKMNPDTTLMALYELETITSRFGGKYARKVLATLQPVTGIYAERAKEMGIELWHYKN